MKYFRKIFFFAPLTILVFLFFTGIYTEAAETQKGYQLLAPIPTITDASGAAKTVGVTLVEYMKGIFTAAIGLAIIMAVVQLVIGGVEYVAAALPSTKEDAKKRITGAVGGLLLILVSYIILDTLNPGLLSVGLNLEQVAVPEDVTGVVENNHDINTICTIGSDCKELCITITKSAIFTAEQNCAVSQMDLLEKHVLACDETAPVPKEGCITKTCDATVSTIPKECIVIVTPPATESCPTSSSEYTAGDNTIRAQLTAGGVDVKSNKCVQCGERGCTSVYGLPENAIYGLTALKASCGGCVVAISGGTEAGHETHGIGKPIVDIRHSPSLDNFLFTNYVCTKSIGGKVYYNSGAWYWAEPAVGGQPAHFHVTYGISQCK